MGDLSGSPKPNYHSVLGISKNATLSEIIKAYKTLVMKWHPDKNRSNKAEAEDQFNKITEAYRVLSSKKREESAIPIITDHPKTPKTPKFTFQFHKKDDEALASGRHTPILQSPNGHRKSKTPTSTCADFYAYSTKISPPTSTSSPSTPTGDVPLFSRVGTSRRSSSTPIIFSQSIAQRKAPPPIEKKLECTLEELWRGCVKKIKITRDVISETGIIVQEEEILKINVKPGWKKGTKITFEGKGDEKPGNLPADIIFIIDEKKHPVFKREGDDLELGVEVPLVDALTGCTIIVPILGGGTMSLSLDEILHPGYEKIVPEQGMPKSKEDGRRGDLRLKFLVEFPTKLSDEQRYEVLSVLNESF